MRHFRFMLLSLLCLSHSLYAASSFFCTSQSNYINLGDTIDQAFTKCGAPASSKTEQTADTKPTQVTQWVFSFQNNSYIRTGQTVTQAAALIINLSNTTNKVISILVNGQNVQSTYFCSPNQPISIGDDNLRVRQVCNMPTQIQTVIQNIAEPSVTRTTWTYNQEFSKPVTLVFDNGVLKSIN